MIIDEVDQKQKYFVHGKYFDDPDEMFKYCDAWGSFNLDQQNAERILDGLKKEILMNVLFDGKEFSNSEFSQYVEEVFIYSMKRLRGDKCQENVANVDGMY